MMKIGQDVFVGTTKDAIFKANRLFNLSENIKYYRARMVPKQRKQSVQKPITTYLLCICNSRRRWIEFSLSIAWGYNHSSVQNKWATSNGNKLHAVFKLINWSEGTMKQKDMKLPAISFKSLILT